MTTPQTTPELPTLPQSLLNTIGEYGMARTDRVTSIEITHRWELLIAGIKDYAASVRDAATQTAKAAPEGCPDKTMAPFACKNRAQCWEPCGLLGHNAETARIAPEPRQSIAPRFQHTFCQACGKDCGPGDDGPIDCRGHGPKDEPQPIADWQVQIMQDWEPRRLTLRIGVQSFFIDVQDEPDEPGRMEWYLAQLTGAMQKLTTQPLAPSPGCGVVKKRATELQEKASMPWEQAVELALSEQGISLPLYQAINKLVCQIGYEGSIDSDRALVTEVMDALHDLDGGTSIAASPQPPASVQPLAVGVEDALNVLADIRKDLRTSKFGGLQCDELERQIRALAASPPSPGGMVPLTTERITDIAAACYCDQDREADDYPVVFARAIEAAHGISEGSHGHD